MHLIDRAFAHLPSNVGDGEGVADDAFAALRVPASVHARRPSNAFTGDLNGSAAHMHYVRACREQKLLRQKADPVNLMYGKLSDKIMIGRICLLLCCCVIHFLSNHQRKKDTI